LIFIIDNNMSKMLISEQKLNRLVSDCIYEVIEEVATDEGVMSWLGDKVGKIQKWVNNGVQDFRDARNAQYQQPKRTYTRPSYQAPSYTRTAPTAQQGGGDMVNVKPASNEKKTKVTLQQIGNAIEKLTKQYQALMQQGQQGTEQPNATPQQPNATPQQPTATPQQPNGEQQAQPVKKKTRAKKAPVAQNS
jgi:hypothetical protein